MARMGNTRFKDLANRDYANLCSRIRLRTNDEIAELLFMQTVEGHAHEGHGAFRKQKKFSEITIEDVVCVLGFDTEEIKQERQKLIDEMKDFTCSIIRGNDVKRYSNKFGEPLFGAQFLEELEIKDPAAVLKGIYLGSRMDRYTGWRQKAEEIYGITIGGGECVGVNRKLARQKGITFRSIAKMPHTEEEINKMFAENILCSDVESSSEIVSSYVRKAKGKGTSDDLAVLLAGRLFGFDAAVGLYLTDAVDTWDKYVPFIYKHGQDEQLGDKIAKSEEKIRQKIKGFRLPSDEEVYRFISVIAEANYDNIISSSQRYFLQIDPNSGLSAIESHLEYIKGNKVPEVHIGYFSNKLTNHKMYKQFEAKYAERYKP